MQHSPYAHNVFFSELEQWLEDFGMDEASASALVHDFTVERGETDTPDYQTFLNLNIPECLHCQARTQKVV